MAIISPDELARYLSVIKQSGAVTFSWGDWHVTFGPSDSPQVQREPGFRPTASKDGKSIWENPSLWPGGVVPKFPTKE